jgi:hypothetical protein
MKVVEEKKKTVTIKELDVTEILMDMETGENVDLNELVKEHFDSGDCVKAVFTRQLKEEE